MPVIHKEATSVKEAKPSFLKEKISAFYRWFSDFLKNVLLLFQQNFKEVMLFVLFCAACSMILTALLKNVVLDLAMRVSGTTYIVPSNLSSVFLHPVSLILILLFVFLISLLSLFEIAGLLHAYSMSQVGRDTNLVSMFAVGLETCFHALHPKNWLLIFFIIVLFPLTKILPLSSSTFKLILPGFVYQTIEYTSSLRILYRIVYFGLLCVSVLYLFSINIFVLQRKAFLPSCRDSRKLGQGQYLRTFFTMALYMLLLNIVINSVSSIVVINIRELVALFQSSTGVVSKSAEIGTYTYVLRQLLRGLFAPAINNAALVVLYFRYIEDQNQLHLLSPEIFKERQLSKKIKIPVVSVLVVLLAVSVVYFANKYAFLGESVDMPMVCAHRGDNVNAPENTMPAFELAASEGLPWIELDVHQTSDGVIVCNHDSSIGRVTGKDLSVHEHTFAELASMEFGDWMPGNYQHVTVPTLEEALSMAREEGLHVQVELKGHPDDIDFEKHVLEAIERSGMHDQVMIIAQDYARLETISALDPTILKAYCMFFAYGALNDIPCTDNVSIEETNVTPELVRRLHEQGMKVFCWTVDLEDTIQYLVSCDVDVIGTDNPLMVRAALEKVDYSGGIRRAFYLLMNTIAAMEK